MNLYSCPIFYYYSIKDIDKSNRKLAPVMFSGDSEVRRREGERRREERTDSLSVLKLKLNKDNRKFSSVDFLFEKIDLGNIEKESHIIE